MSIIRDVLPATLLIVELYSLAGQSGTTWRDPSPHQVRFVTVDSSVRLEVLDWGGTGRPVLFVGLYMFLSNEADVLREVRAFAATLQP